MSTEKMVLLLWFMSYGTLQGGQRLSSTTRHVRIFVGYVNPKTMVMDKSQADQLSLMLDPDNEFIWPDQQV